MLLYIANYERNINEHILCSDTNLNKVYEMRPSSSIDKGYESATDNINNGYHSAYRLNDYQTGGGLRGLGVAPYIFNNSTV